MARILILEDSIEMVHVLRGMLEDKGHVVEAEMNPGQVMEKVRGFKPELITLDVSFSEGGDEIGIDLLKEIRKEYSKVKLPIIVVSATLNADKLTRMMAYAVNGYIGKPVKQEDLVKKVGDCLETMLPPDCLVGNWESRMVGESPAILALIVEIDKTAKAQSSLLITGECGSGKEQIVCKYRELSPRKNKPFVVIDCTNISHNTFESEIFGHEKGAFTGASERKKGKIEAAAGGIIFFDEIGDLPQDQQQKLLRLLQAKSFTRMGSNEEIKIDVVILAATNKNLYDLMQQGKFREDLYYRLKYINIEMPPLREHLEDISSLVAYFIQAANQSHGKSISGVESDVIQRFKHMRWNGNVRELEKCVGHGVVKCDGQRLKWRDVEGYFKSEAEQAAPAQANPVDLKMNYKAFKKFLEADRKSKEKRFYTFHLEQHQYHVQNTARELNMSRTYLMHIMKRLGIKKLAKD